MNRFEHLRLCVVMGACLAGASIAHAAPLSKDEAKARKASIEAQYKSAREACNSLSGNAKDICVEQAKGQENVAKAELDDQHEPSASSREKLAKARAEATYAVAKERCDDLAGNPKDVCVKEAKAAHTQGLADAKANRETSKARSDAAEDKNDARYAVEIAKCDSLAGDAKSACVSAAKARFGKT